MNVPVASDRVLLTVGVEDYYQVGSFEGLIQRENWYRFETRIARNTARALDLLDAFGIRATFFVLGWVGDAMPEVVREIVGRGHEVASGGYWHRTIGQMTPAELRVDLRRSREALERAGGTRVLGHRVPHFLGPADLWALDVVAEEGYAYDSSLRPLLRRFAAEPWRRAVHRHTTKGRRLLWEVPPSSWSLCGLTLPLAGGNYFRQLPHTLVKPLVRRWHREHREPFVMYFHVWELDPEQPKINTGSPLTRLRHYRNLDKMDWVLRDYFETFQVSGVAEYLGLEPGPAPERPAPRQTAACDLAPRNGCVPVSVVVPCYNEEGSLAYLANTLRSVAVWLKRDYEVSFLFVDDGSRDGTWELLNRLFGSRPGCTLLRHDRNRGVAAAILTGLQAAKTEIVCSIDCDCTYDPHGLAEMIPRLTDGVDLVTASPYHPRGRVVNVPRWRLALSRGASFLYRRVLRQKLHTYTSCFRVYRRSAVAGLDLREEGYLGVAEMLARLDLRGSAVVEHPATLEVRLLGHSKMKALRSVVGHLKLLARLAVLRLSGRSPAADLRPLPSGAPHE